MLVTECTKTEAERLEIRAPTLAQIWLMHLWHLLLTTTMCLLFLHFGQDRHCHVASLVHLLSGHHR